MNTFARYCNCLRHQLAESYPALCLPVGLTLGGRGAAWGSPSWNSSTGLECCGEHSMARSDWSAGEARVCLCICVCVVLGMRSSWNLCIEWPRRDQSLGLFGNILCEVSRLTGKLCWGLSHMSVLSAPCCCGFYPYVLSVRVSVPRLRSAQGFVKSDLAHPSQRSRA
ncbi:hypothetical protein ILYODFUR_022373 [Ilyodon furcidens]|uniref:Uncharacterized protein n=1 Tax=Ilyodon furcidens TaxID=33524 RepID=A0ABV0TWT0_9TELE